MPELNVERDRYDGQSVIPHLSADNIQWDGNVFYIEAPLGDDDEFALYFDAARMQIDDTLLDAAKRLMTNIGSIDNQVQEFCAAECRRSGLHPSHYEGMLAFVTLTQDPPSHPKARLRYFGTRVNTEWDELVEMQHGHWVHTGAATPDLSARET